MDLFSLILFCKKELASVVPESLAHEYAWLLVTHAFSKTKTELIMYPPRISQEMHDRITQFLSSIVLDHKPIQYILKTIPFLDLTLELEPPVLICRPETEALVLQIIAMLKPYRDEQFLFLDIGTGSGCIALSLAKAFPQSEVYATDISPIALELARKNAEKNKINNVVFIASDLFSDIQPTLLFDLIISNPPYISHAEWEFLEPSVKQWEDPLALVAPDDGLSILTAIIKQAKNHLNLNSKLTYDGVLQLVLEIGHAQGEKVKMIMQQELFSNVTIWCDQYGKDRAVWGAV